MRELLSCEKWQHFYLGAKKGGSIVANRKTVIHGTGNLGISPILELTSDKESEMDQELANRDNLYDKATCI